MGILFGCLQAAPNPQDIQTVSSTINAVTVYQDRAQVTRQARLDLNRGEHHLLFDNLPDRIERNSIQVRGTGTGKIRDVIFQTVRLARVSDERLRTLLDERQRLEDLIRTADERIVNAGKEKNFVDAIAERLTQSPEKETTLELNPYKWKEMVAFYRVKHDTLDLEIRSTEKRKRELEAEHQRLAREIQDLGRRQDKTINQVRVDLDMDRSETVSLEISYIVYGPGWTPAYDLRVSTQSKKMTLAYYGTIRQNTSEDWSDVRIALSTARPQIGGEQPSLSPWYLHFSEPVRTRTGALMRPAEAPEKRTEVQMFRAEETEAAAMEEEAPGALVMEDASVESGATAVVFQIPGRNSVLSDNQPHKVTVLIQEFPAFFRYSTVPKLASHVYLKARVKNETEYPLMAGKTNVFLDNHFVASSRLKPVAPSDTFWTFLGVDESITVERQLLNRYEDLSRKNRKMTLEYRISLKNSKTSKEEIVVWDQVPISTHEDIRVELLEPKMDRNTASIKMNDLNYLEWFFTLDPGQEIRIPFRYSVEYPKDRIVRGL
jgi:uncharacterized protein (TIGR02231 family)